MRSIRMRIMLLVIFLASGPSIVCSPHKGAANRTTETEVEELKKRVAQLEIQNKAILKIAARLEARLRDQAPEKSSRAKVASAGTLASLSAAEMVSAESQNEREVSSVNTEGGSALSFYGFVRVDAIIDDSRPNRIQVPTFTRSEGLSTGLNNNSDFAFHPRLTRLGMNYRGPVLDTMGGARIVAKVETDFQNGGRESRAIARYRQAFLRLDWEKSSLLLGQTWDIISPLYPTVNNDTMMWNAGNLGDRRMQLRYTYEPEGGFSLRAGLGLTGAVDAQDLDGNGFRDGEESAAPHLQARVGYKSTDSRAEVGLWGHYARERTQSPIGGATRFDGHSVGIDYNFQLNSVVSLKGELWRGSNLSDLRGGIGQGINTQSGREIGSRGGWIELGLKASRRYAFSAGFTFDDPEDKDIPSKGRTENRVWYVTNRFRLADPFMFGIDYLYWRTDFKDLAKGTNKRLNLYVLYNF